MENILEVRGLSKSYKKFSLEDIDLDIPKGSIMGLVGENGSGKTTTIKAILNIIKRDKGDVGIFGLDNIEHDIEIKEDIGVVLDDSYFEDNLNAKDINKIMKNIYKKWDSKLYFEYLKKFKIDEEKRIKEYSKGMKMKLSISIALSHNAKLLILDEPTSGLDPVVRSEILDELQNFIQDEENSILFSTHITSDLDKIADYITLIHEGRIILSMDRESLLTNYGLLKTNRDDFDRMDKDYVMGFKENRFGLEALITNRFEFLRRYPDSIVDEVNIEDIMLFYIRG